MYYQLLLPIGRNSTDLQEQQGETQPDTVLWLDKRFETAVHASWRKLAARAWLASSNPQCLLCESLQPLLLAFLVTFQWDHAKMESCQNGIMPKWNHANWLWLDIDWNPSCRVLKQAANWLISCPTTGFSLINWLYT